MEKGKKTIDKNSIRFTIMAVVLIAIFCFAISPVTLQNDTFYTIKIGEHILQNGIDMKDPFSWHENLQYTYPHWLYDVVIYLVYNIGGQVGIYISTIVLSITLGLTMYLVNTKLTKNKLTYNRSNVFIKKLHSSKSSTCNIYIIYTHSIFYRNVFRNKEKKICSRINNNTNNNCKCTFGSVSILLCTISTIYSRIHDIYTFKYRNYISYS